MLLFNRRDWKGGTLNYVVIKYANHATNGFTSDRYMSKIHGNYFRHVQADIQTDKLFVKSMLLMDLLINGFTSDR